MKTHLSKVEHFISVHPWQLEDNEWKVKWPIAHSEGKSYNPDFFNPALGCYVEVVTSWPNYSTGRKKWRAAILAGYHLRVYWWTGGEITGDVLYDVIGSVVRQSHSLNRD